MAALFDMCRMTTSTTGTGTITLGSAVQSFLTFAQAGVSDQQVVRYVIEDPPNREVGSGTYTASGTTLTRSVNFSTNSNSAISLSGSAQVAITALAEDIVNKAGDTMSGQFNVSVATAASTQEYQEWKPTDWAAGKPYLAVKSAGAGTWQILLWDGSNNNGTLNFILQSLKWNGTSLSTLQAIAPAVNTFTSSQTVTIPTGATKCKVTLVGGGGGGGGGVGSVASACAPGSNGAGGPGGPGGVLIKYLTGLTGGNTFSLTIGAGGSAGSSAPGNGGNGGDSSLSSGSQSITTLTAGKGAGGASANGATGAAGAAGGGTNGDVNITGGTGFAANAVPSSQSGATGLGFGPSVGVASVAGAAGSAAVGFGGGGAGGVTGNLTAQAGGAGAAGLAIFEWYP